ncbi:hypothetical protein Tco_0051226 [Tanacetum coccineum]
MVACLERTDGNAEFHQIVDFLTTSTIHYALTQIHATVDGKTSVISESSVRSDLHFNDKDGITCLSNDEIFIALAEPFNDIYVTPVHTKKVFTNMKRQNKDFSGRVTPLFASMLVPKVVEGEGSGQPSEPQPPSSTGPPSQSSGPSKKVGDEAVYTGEDDRVVRAATTATSLEAEQESDNIHKTRPTATLNEPSPQGTGSGSGPRCQDTTLGGADAQTKPETASKKSHDPPLLEVNTSGSGEDSMEHQDDLTDFLPPTPHDSPLSGGHIHGSDEGMKLFKIGTSRRKSLDKENVSKQGMSLKTKPIFEEGDFNDDFDDNVKEDTINAGGAVNTATTGVSAANASVTTAGVTISTAEPRTPPTTTTTAFKDKDLTIDQTLVKMRSEKAKVKGVAFRDVEEPRRSTPAPIAQSSFKDKERMQRERAAQEEASNATLTAEFDDVQARMDADALLAARLQEEEREQFSIDEQARFLVETIAERKRFTHNQLKNKSLEEIQKLYERKQKWINDFVPLDSEMVKNSGKKDEDSRKEAESSQKQVGSSKKRSRTAHDEESVKKQKLEDDAEKEELRACLDIVPGDDIAINVESLATK